MATREQAEELVNAFEATLAMGGIANPYDWGEKIYQWALRNREIVDRGLAAMRSHDAHVELLASSPEHAPSTHQLALLLFHMAPKIIRTDIDKTMQRIAKQIEKPAGRPHAADSNAEKIKICDSVSALSRKGTSLNEAQQRTADKFGVSFRSVQRIWGQRGVLGESQPETIIELFAEIAKL